MADSSHTFICSVSTSHGILKGISNTSLQSQVYMDKFQDVRRLIHKSITGSPIESVKIIDTLQHLAIDYHFQSEIQYALGSLYKTLSVGGSLADNCLSSVLLAFRLLRQNGYHFGTDVFKRFVHKQEKFGDNVTPDLKEMMGLHQASQFVIDGEDPLEQVNTLISKRLHDCVPHLSQDEATLVSHNLDCPSAKTLTRFNLKSYLKTHQKGQGNSEMSLREFAKMDFNLVQSLHRQELQQVSSWWSGLGLAQKLDFARDQPIKWYMWSMATLDDPMLSDQRIQLTKPIALIYLMDDIFDCYGTLEELVLFTEAINKWEARAIEQLPYPMKIFLKALYDLTEEISHEIHRRHGWNPIHPLKRAWKLLANAFLVEAKWFASGNMPGSEEYLQNGVISSGVHVVFVHIFFLLGQGINQETVNLLDDIPPLVSGVAKILRLWDDLGSAKDENQQGYDGSYIECYMKENEKLTIEDTREHVADMIASTWNQLYKEYLLPSPFSPSFKKASLNAAKMVRLMYSYDANQRLPSLEKHIKSLLFESISLAR